jgi:lipopolysaccharide/colanic/teichoic acid biosynthesis glycosyltransferase
MDFPIELDVLKCSPSPKAVQDSYWKRTLDALLILLALPFLIPLALLLALLIRSGSRGPVLFRQERVGYRGGALHVFQVSNHVCGCRHDHASGTPASFDEFEYPHDENGLTR